ncbi:MAG: tetratricopeptide repeat protein [Bacteroidales bacterium]|jgi:tetratricopeptide (TPR) repeat protein|nr:tetratricopeptide repeat protein [Bacteroidales bacterium]
MKGKVINIVKKSFLIIFNFIIFTNVNAENTKILIDSAFNCYMNKDYESTIKIYTNLYNQNYSSADLFYNLGNCYIETKDIANAIYFYEKALILSPNDEDILYNLKIANARIKDKVEVLPEIFYISWFKQLMSLMSSDSWAISAIISLIITLLLVFLFLFSNKSKIKKLCFYISILTLLITILTIIFSAKSAKNTINNKFAIIFESTMVKSSPNEEGSNLFEINEGLKVEIKDSINSWYEIKLSDGKDGWIHSENCKKL